MKKLAVVISGAVSLGSYEAGVMFEMLAALTAHNAANPASPVVIDVITGASAGGMNAVILAQKLLFQASRLQDPADNDLYLPWVKDVDLTGLLATASDESPLLSALSSDAIEAISKKYLIAPYSQGINIEAERPHPAVAPQLKLGLAMSNLNGIDYGLDLLSGGTMPYTRFQDQVIVDVDSTNPDHDTADFWEPLRNAAVACGAFPFAFRVKDLLRHSSDYTDPAPLRFPATGMHFAYTDGGLFQNEPIALAKRLVDDIDAHVNDERYYLFVAPGMRQSACNDGSAAPGSPYFDYLNTTKSLIDAIFNQARYRDLDNVERINRQVARFDEQAEQLKGLFLNRTVDAERLGAATTPLLLGLFPDPAPGQTLGPDGVAARARLQTQFAPEYQQLTDAVGAANANAWIDAVLLLESTASLGPRDSMSVYAITDDADCLAGAALMAFGGFFDVRYRQHDYDRGRQSARDFIQWLNGTNKGLAPIQYNAAAAPPLTIDPDLDGVTIDDIDRGKRQALYDRLHDRINDLMEELKLNGVVRETIFLAYVDGAMKRLFGL